MGAPEGYPYALRAFRARRSPQKRKDPAANFGLNRESSGLNCPFGASRTRVHAHTRYIMCTPSGCTYGCPLGHPLEPGARRADERQKKKKNKSRPIMGAPAGHPYAHPEGVCINGLGALPSPYGPTLRGAHNGPSGLQKIKSKSTERNNGQKLCKLGQYVRLYVHLPHPLPPPHPGQN